MACYRQHLTIIVSDVMWKCKATSLFCHFCGAAIFISGLPSIYPSFSLPDSMRSVGWNAVRHAPLDLNTGASPKQTEKSGIQELRHSFRPALSITVFLMCLDFGSNIYRPLLLSILYDASSVTVKISDFRQLIIPTHSALVILKRVYFWPKD